MNTSLKAPDSRTLRKDMWASDEWKRQAAGTVALLIAHTTAFFCTITQAPTKLSCEWGGVVWKHPPFVFFLRVASCIFLLEGWIRRRLR